MAEPEEASLLVEGGSEADAEAAPAGDNAGAWTWGEGVEGAGDRPDWFVEKFSTVEDQAKAYQQLEQKFSQKQGSFVGAPDEGYAVNMPEGIQAEIDPEDPLLSTVSELCKEGNASQEFFDGLVEAFVTNVQAMTQAGKADQLEILGTEGPAKIKALTEWGQANLDEEGYRSMQAFCTTAEAVEFMHSLHNKFSAGTIVPEKAAEPTQQGWEKIETMLADDRAQSDPQFQQEIEKVARKLAG